MHDLINKLVFSLFKKSNLEECSSEEIEELAKQYPYFPSAQLLLAAKQKQSGHPDFEKQLNTASLHINNPMWLDHLLSTRLHVEKTVVEAKIPVEEVFEEPNNDELVLQKTNHEFIVASRKDEVVTAPPGPLAETTESKDVFEEPNNDELVLEKTNDEFIGTPGKEEVVPAPPVPVNETAETKEQEQKPLVFEPYYTVDYFASQGIKNVIEEKPKDRFSQQLKSFTEWLKTIRQLPPQQVAAMTDVRSEEKVVELATHSIEDRSVETEAMAEVWIKQGEPEKAAEIYRKLSLLNPSKSSYFASLIEKLKNP